jgi:hypothetical protein
MRQNPALATSAYWFRRTDRSLWAPSHHDDGRNAGSARQGAGPPEQMATLSARPRNWSKNRLRFDLSHERGKLSPELSVNFQV